MNRFASTPLHVYLSANGLNFIEGYAVITPNPARIASPMLGDRAEAERLAVQLGPGHYARFGVLNEWTGQFDWCACRNPDADEFAGWAVGSLGKAANARLLP